MVLANWLVCASVRSHCCTCWYHVWTPFLLFSTAAAYSAGSLLTRLWNSSHLEPLWWSLSGVQTPGTEPLLKVLGLKPTVGAKGQSPGSRVQGHGLVTAWVVLLIKAILVVVVVRRYIGDTVFTWRLKVLLLKTVFSHAMLHHCQLITEGRS